MESLINVLMFSFFGWSFLNRYRKDQGKHLSAKIIHAAVILFLGWYYVSSILNVAWFIRNASSFVVFDGQNVLPGFASIAILGFRTVLSLIFFFQCYWMIRRDPDARTWFLRLIPALAILEIFEFFRIGPFTIGMPDLPYAVFVVVGVAAVSIGLIYLYRMPFMRHFYFFEDHTTAEELIEKIGEEEQ